MAKKMWVLISGLVIILGSGLLYANRPIQAQAAGAPAEAVKQNDIDKILNGQKDMQQDIRFIKDEVREIKRIVEDIKRTVGNQ